MTSDPEVEPLLKRAEMLGAVSSITYPSIVAAGQIRALVRELALALTEADAERRRLKIMLEATQGAYVHEREARVPVETTARIGPDTPDNGMVICPNCTSQFYAISVDDQAKLSHQLTPRSVEGLKTFPYRGAELQPVKSVLGTPNQISDSTLANLIKFEGQHNDFCAFVELWERRGAVKTT